MIRRAIPLKYYSQLVGERGIGIGIGSKKYNCLETKAYYYTKRTFSNNNKSEAYSVNFDKTPSNQGSYFSAFLKWYSEKLDAYPITTKCISSGIISGFGDLICQYMTQPVLPDGHGDDDPNEPFKLSWDSWDSARTGRFATLGAAWVGPILHYWYGILSRTFPHHTVLRVALDQLLMAPFCLSTFLGGLWWWEGDTPETVLTRLKENVPSIVVLNWSLWVPAQVINFRFVLPKYQVLFSNFVGLFWNAYLSYASRSENQPLPVPAPALVSSEQKD